MRTLILEETRLQDVFWGVVCVLLLSLVYFHARCAFVRVCVCVCVLHVCIHACVCIHTLSQAHV